MIPPLKGTLLWPRRRIFRDLAYLSFVPSDFSCEVAAFWISSASIDCSLEAGNLADICRVNVHVSRYRMRRTFPVVRTTGLRRHIPVSFALTYVFWPALVQNTAHEVLLLWDPRSSDRGTNQSLFSTFLARSAANGLIYFKQRRLTCNLATYSRMTCTHV